MATLTINAGAGGIGEYAGVAEVAPYGQTSRISFGTGASDWAAGETWTINFTTGAGDFTVGKGNIAGQAAVCGMKLATRMFVGYSTQIAFSANADPTGWEEQNTGAGTIAFLSQYGIQDAVKAFSHLQGRLVVFGSYSIQTWNTDADPNNFSLVQTLDNSGTIATFSVQAIGDVDVLYLDNTGFRSLRAKAQTNNAYVSDIGTAIDLTVRSSLLSGSSGVCSITEPTTKQYWCYLNSVIYVLSNYPESKIVAWSTFTPSYQSNDNYRIKNSTGGSLLVWVGNVNDYTKGTQYTITNGSTQSLTAPVKYVWSAQAPSGTPTVANVLVLADNFAGTVDIGDPIFPDTAVLTSNQTTFTPEKFVVYSNKVYVRATSGKVYLYGGSGNNTYDNVLPVVELPWLDLKEPSMMKQFKGLDVAIKGNWTAFMSANPRGATIPQVLSRGSASTPTMVADSTFDVGNFPFSGTGTHVKIKLVGFKAAEEQKLGKISVLYSGAGKK